MSNFNEETVLSVHHWTDNLFSFKTTRDPSFRFRNGEFTMIGIPVNGKPLLRAYSVASAHYEEQLEFFSIKVSNGPLTSRLQHLKVGDPVMVILALIVAALFVADLRLDPLDAEHARVMMCGSPGMLNDTKALLLDRGFIEGNHGEPGQFVIEKAFVER